jgi:hypothetical protein
MVTTISVRAWMRPIYLLKVLNGLTQCRGLQKYKLLISCDHFDHSMAEQLYEAIQCSNILDRIETDIVFHDTNLGCTGNFRFCLKQSFKDGQDYAIFVEDDSYLSIDCLEYFEQTLHLLKDYFALCTLNRPCHQTIPPKPEDFNKLVARDMFEGANVFCIGRKTYDKIEAKGGIFGVDWISDRGKRADCRGEDWLKEVRKSDRLGWDNPMEKFFRDLPCIFPVIGRTLNIGKSGLHLSPNQWLQTHYNENWIQHPNYACKIVNKPVFDIQNILIDTNKYTESGYE